MPILFLMLNFNQIRLLTVLTLSLNLLYNIINNLELLNTSHSNGRSKPGVKLKAKHHGDRHPAYRKVDSHEPPHQPRLSNIRS